MSLDVNSFAAVVSAITGTTSAIVAGGVVHGVLRPQLEGRGVKPWRRRDTLASTPLILIGSAGVGAAASLIGVGVATVKGASPPYTMLIIGGGGLLLSAFVLLQGVMALRKLAPE
ncbi:MAG: hypothetical protein ABJB74_09955 [Gemmatimonas sp.]